MDRDPYFENNSSKYSAEAIRLDSGGFQGAAILYYEKAIEELVKFRLLHPAYKWNKVYMERAGAYKNRIKAIKKARRKKLQTLICITIACVIWH